VDTDVLAAYLAGVIDGDGYFKVTKGRRQESTRPYYHVQIGLQQLWPGEAVHLFSKTFSGKMMKPMLWSGHRPIARCEISDRRAELAIGRLLRYLLVKRYQAELLLDLNGLRSKPKLGRFSFTFTNSRGLRITKTYPWFSPEQLEAMERIRGRVLALHEGKCFAPTNTHRETWTQEETLAYLAGVMDSDGNFRITRRPVKGMLGPHYRINIRAAQVLPSPAVSLLAKTFGGNVTIKRSKRPTQRDLVSWSLFDKMAVPAIMALLPYLVVKTPEAYLLLELRRLKDKGKEGLTEWEHQTRWHRPVKMHKGCYTPVQVANFEFIHRLVMGLHSGEPLETIHLNGASAYFHRTQFGEPNSSAGEGSREGVGFPSEAS
jgi:hypothetical protein